MRLVGALAFFGAVLPPLAGAQVTDSVAHPIATGCGPRIDPVAYVLARTDELSLNAEEVTRIQALGRALDARNRPFGQRWWSGQRSDPVQRKEILDSLRAHYLDAMDAMEAILGAERWVEVLRPPPRDASQGMLRCYERAIPVIIGDRVRAPAPDTSRQESVRRRPGRLSTGRTGPPARRRLAPS